ncbi:helix-turn-helix transcriptional regulator [Actinomadura chibensis]|uniref:Helix-turn-helix transcriptional regulator n=1 Tax=Actinomadura chibensis TaxID=392828 RepID=A0A5D0NEF3_9ACTN|nr:helix-turn-helix transcriptional regulator [Actinomadura chibensis]TYB42904.1 helix-turn-helix transcriptional regulator [Actinomadura chibensis]
MVTVGDRLRRSLCEALLPGAGLERIGAELSRVVAPVVAHDALRCGVMNPATGWGVTSLAFWHGYEPDLGRALLTVDGVTTDVRDRARPAVADLGLRPRDPLLGREPIGTELRLVLRDARGVWGVLCLLRAADVRRRFDDADAARLTALAPALIAALRGYVTAGPGAPADPGPAPGMLVIGADDRIRATTPQARTWLDAMAVRLAVPDWLTESSFASLAVAAREGPRAPRLCVPSVGAGWWTAIEAQPLGGGEDEGEVAVVIQRATGALLLPSYCDWYGITVRERQVIQRLQRGDAPKQIARAFDLSVHTVNDHLKAIFRKTGAAGRDELMAALNV